MTAISETEVNERVDHLFRRHAGQMVAVLCRIFGFERIDLIEDAVQDALVAALRKWPFTGMPDNPTAWLTQAAKNRLIDRLRRDSRSQTDVEDLDLDGSAGETPVFFTTELSEDQLRMIFACCHPALTADAQVALTLKIVGGFSVSEIASAYLAREDAISKMLTRAKSRLRESMVTLEIPVANEIPERLDAVLKVLYLMFNEGYGASGGNELVRRDLCFEAIRLIELLAAQPMTNSPKVHAAAALFFFQASRLPARTDDLGELILLETQDRALWDNGLICRGIRHLRLSGSGGELSAFHLEAEIASIHALSPDYASTDWRRVLKCYETMQKISFSPVAELNRIIAVARANGPHEALAELERLESTHEKMSAYNLFHITRGQLYCETGDHKLAENSFRIASKLTKNQTVKRLIERKLKTSHAFQDKLATL
ncbi:MAG: RNA polymerase sigma factor [Pyrinomonadaceae bacterium]